MNSNSRLGIIGGSGIYDIPGLQNSDWVRVDSNFGNPSDKLLVGMFNQTPVTFLPRHGRKHQYNPSNINYKSNIEALKITGVTKIISITAVGSLNEKLSPGNLILANQFIDNTKHRDNTFFQDDLVAHVSLSDPVCSELNKFILDSGEDLKIKITHGSTHIVIEGPHFSTKAESNLYRTWGADLVGMTSMPEVKLAREAELCYSNLSLVTDYDCWRDQDKPVSAKDVMKNFNDNIPKIHLILNNLTKNKNLMKDCKIGCPYSLNNALTSKLTDNRKSKHLLRNIISRLI